MPATASADCLDEQQALDLVDGALTGPQRARIHEHLAACPACAALVADLARALGAEPPPGPISNEGLDSANDPTDDPTDDPTGDTLDALDELTAPLTPGTAVGPYRVCRPLAAGGMGVVYVAEDPRLDRTLALKLLRADLVEPGAGARLRREAQALARLSSPHVVTVHAAGDSPYGAWVAMELVTGGTLADWIRAGPHPWPAVLTRFTAAAQGLRDAHAAGIVHRDFKPSNVLLGDDGRILVADFGLAATHDAPTPPAELDRSTEALDRVTRTGGVVGTPAYMAPEQLAGQPAHARSDQFSWCVALFEALFGQRPYPGQTLAALVQALEHGRRCRIERPRSVPAWLRRAIERGLEPDPRRRYRDMDHLLAAVDPARRRRTTTRWIAGLALLLPVAALAWAGHAADSAADCEQVDRTRATVWNDARRQAIADAFTGSGDPAAPSQLARVVRQLEERMEAWHRAATEACRTTVRGEAAQAPHLDQHLQCLQTALDETDTAIEALARVSAPTVARADTLLPGLTPLARCDDPAYLDAVIEPPADPDATAAVQQLRREVARARARLSADPDLEATIATLRLLHQRAQDLDYAPLQVHAALLLGRALHLHGDSALAIERLEPAFFAAQRQDDPSSASEAASLLTQAHGHGRSDLDEALRWSRHAEAAARAMDDPVEQAVALLIRGELLYTAERYEEAERTLRAARDRLPPDAPLRPRASVAETLGNLYAAQWQPERALPFYDEALALQERRVGPDHHDLLRALNGRAVSLVQLERYDQALTTFERTRVIAEAGGSLTAPLVSQLLTNLGALHELRDQLEPALRYYEDGLARLEPQVGPDHQETLVALYNVANVQRKLGRHPEAIQTARDLVERGRPQVSSLAGIVSRALWVQAQSHQALGQSDAARQALAQRLALRREHTPDDAEGITEAEADLAALVTESPPLPKP